MSTDTLHIPDDVAALQSLIVQQHAALQLQQRAFDEQQRMLEERERLLLERARLLEEQQRVLSETSAAYAQLRQERDRLREEFELLRRWAFGRRRERFDEAAGQRHLFGEPEGLAPEPPPTDAAEPEVTAAPQFHRRRAARKLKLDHLPQRRIEHDVPDTEKVCGCGRAKVKIGEDESPVLNYRPAVLEVEVHVLPKYACPCCRDGVTSPPVPPRPLERALPGPGLISQILVSKFGDHLPLYRQEDILLRHGLHIARSTLCDWVRGAAELLTPLATRQKQLVLRSPLLWTDDTTVRLLDREAEGGSRQARFWTYIDDDDHPYAVYDFTPSRSRDGPADFLKDYAGYLHADAYSAYDGIYLNSGGRIIEIACGAHIRRKFVEARTSAPADSARMVDRFRQLYEIEDRARVLSVADRAALRQAEAVPILARMQTHLDELTARPVLPKSPLGKAVTYARNQWEAFCRYTTDGRLTIDNNLSERTLRTQAVGRKNWMFLGHENAGPRAAVVCTIIAGAKRHRLEPWAYLTDVLLHLATKDQPDLDRLLPDRWAATHPEHILQHRLNESRRQRARQQQRRATRRNTQP
jgi:transposase